MATMIEVSPRRANGRGRAHHLRKGDEMAERTCSFCERPVLARGLCNTHYARWRRTGDPARSHQGDPALRPVKPVNRKPKRNRAGYVSVWAPDHPLARADGYVMEHRKVVHDAGIVVPPGAHVHHKNGVRDDNRLANLEVISPSDHSRHHALEDGTTNQHGHFASVPTLGETCAVEGCSEPARSKGMCWPHVEQWRTKDPSRPACAVAWCGARARKRGWCEKHYLRFVSTGDPLLVRHRFGSVKREIGPGQLAPWRL